MFTSIIYNKMFTIPKCFWFVRYYEKTVGISSNSVLMTVFLLVILLYLNYLVGLKSIISILPKNKLM